MPSLLSLRLLLPILATLCHFSAAQFNCTDLAEVSMRDDEQLLGVLQKQTDETKAAIETACLGSLIKGNHFKSAIFAIDTLKKGDEIDSAINQIKNSSLVVQDKYSAML